MSRCGVTVSFGRVVLAVVRTLSLFAAFRNGSQLGADASALPFVPHLAKISPTVAEYRTTMSAPRDPERQCTIPEPMTTSRWSRNF